jgi:hypothetical protein
MSNTGELAHVLVVDVPVIGGVRRKEFRLERLVSELEDAEKQRYEIEALVEVLMQTPLVRCYFETWVFAARVLWVGEEAFVRELGLPPNWRLEESALWNGPTIHLAVLGLLTQRRGT